MEGFSLSKKVMYSDIEILNFSPPPTPLGPKSGAILARKAVIEYIQNEDNSHPSSPHKMKFEVDFLIPRLLRHVLFTQGILLNNDISRVGFPLMSLNRQTVLS